MSAEGASSVEIPIVIDIESYLAKRGAHKSFGDPALHKSHVRHSKNTWQRLIDRQAANDHTLAEKREQLRQEFYELVALGILREPTRIERLIRTAQGHSDNESVQAARRLLTKRGIQW